MKDLIRNIIREYVSEGFIRSEEPEDKRHKFVADKIIEFMDNLKITSIPDYSTLSNWSPKSDTTYKPNMKYFLQKNVRKGEYFEKIVPLIKSLRPDFTTSSRSGRHRVDEYEVVFSNGEKIVSNTFRMNGIRLIHQPKDYEFEYVYNGTIHIKKPDFLWQQRNELIEVAGLIDGSFNKDYMKKLQAAKEESEKNGVKMVILDYFSYRKNLQGFYKYVCNFFGFPYDPMDFWTANMVKDLPIEDLEKEAKALAVKNTSKSFGERDRLYKLVTQVLPKVISSEKSVGRPEGYTGVWDFKRHTGIGLRYSDLEFRKKLQNAWCKSSGSDRETTEKFKELYSGEKLSKNYVALIKGKFPNEFSIENKNKICKNI